MDQVQREAISEAFLKSKQSPMIFAEMVHLGLCDTSFMRLICKRDCGLVAGNSLVESYTLCSIKSQQDLEDKYVEALGLALKDEENMFFNSLNKFRHKVPTTGFTAEYLHNLKYEFKRERNQDISKLVISFISWTDIISCPDLGKRFQPKQPTSLQFEYLGTLDGIDLYTDGYRNYELKLDSFLMDGSEPHVYALPENCGVWDSKIDGKAKLTRDYPPEFILNVTTHLL